MIKHGRMNYSDIAESLYYNESLAFMFSNKEASGTFFNVDIENNRTLHL